jgi:signal peptidase II
MIDRIRLGYVIDFIDFCAFPKIWMWIFNVADICVCVGAGLLALWMILDTVKQMKAEKAQKLAAETETIDQNGDENEP